MRRKKKKTEEILTKNSYVQRACDTESSTANAWGEIQWVDTTKERRTDGDNGDG